MRTAVSSRRSAILLNCEWSRNTPMVPLAPSVSQKSLQSKSKIKNQRKYKENVANQMQHPQDPSRFTTWNVVMPCSTEQYKNWSYVANGMLQTQPFMQQPCLGIAGPVITLGNNINYLQKPSLQLSNENAYGTKNNVNECHNSSSLNELSPVAVSAIQDLHSKEFDCQPKMSILSKVDPQTDDRVNLTMRDEAIEKLHFLHIAFFQLSLQTFITAVGLIDRFVAKVKVRPRYLSCLAMACYSIAAQHLELAEKCPRYDNLISLSRCGGSVEDLTRLMDIVRQKLHDQKLFPDASVLNFVPLFYSGGDGSAAANVEHLCRPLLDSALCSYRVHDFSPSCLALGLLTAREPLLSASRGRVLSELCEVSQSLCAQLTPIVTTTVPHRTMDEWKKICWKNSF